MYDSLMVCVCQVVTNTEKDNTEKDLPWKKILFFLRGQRLKLQLFATELLKVFLEYILPQLKI